MADIRWDIAWRHALALIPDDVADPENFASDMVEECLRAVIRGRINAPTRRALLFARRFVAARLRRHELREDLRDEFREDLRDVAARDEHALRLSLHRLQDVWPRLTDLQREAVCKHLAGDVCLDRRRGKVLDNARRRAFALMRGAADA